MGRIYTVQFNTNVGVQVDLFEVTAGTGKPIAIHSIELGQYTEVGDDQEEGLSILLKRGSSATTSGTGGTQGATVSAACATDTAFGGTVDTLNTTKMSGGTITTLRAWVWNVRTGFIKLFVPEARPIIAPGDRLTVELATTPADSIIMTGTIVLEELA